MIKFIEYVLINESDLEDLMISENLPDNIELLHEMEYKIRKIVEHQYKLNPKMYVNVIKRFANFAFECYEFAYPEFNALFIHWLDMHDMEDPEKWARTRFKAGEDSQPDIEDMNRMGITNRIELTKKDVFQYLSLERQIEILEYYASSIISEFENEIPHFLQNMDYPTPEHDEYDDATYWEENLPDAVDIIITNDLENAFNKYVVDSIIDMGEDSGIAMTLNAEDWIKAMERKSFTEFYTEFGERIDNVTPRIHTAIERLLNASTTSKNTRSTIKELHPDAGDLADNVKKLVTAIGEMTSAISLAMNVVHTNGNIILDYGSEFGFEDIDTQYLDDFNNRDIGDWLLELEKLIGKT